MRRGVSVRGLGAPASVVVVRAVNERSGEGGRGPLQYIYPLPPPASAQQNHHLHVPWCASQPRYVTRTKKAWPTGKSQILPCMPHDVHKISRLL